MMNPDDIHSVVVYTARLSTTLFLAAMTGAILRRHAVTLLSAYFAAHLIHFSAVAWFAFATNNSNIRDLGGWPGVLTIGGVFCVLVVCALFAWSGRGNRGVRITGHAGIVMIALSFLASYVPLVSRSVFFALPAVALVTALGFYAVRVLWKPGSIGKYPE